MSEYDEDIRDWVNFNWSSSSRPVFLSDEHDNQDWKIQLNHVNCINHHLLNLIVDLYQVTRTALVEPR